MTKKLAYKDRWLRVQESSIESETEGAIVAPFLLQNEPNKLLTDWTGAQYTEMFNALYLGAHLCFPERAGEIVWQFLRPVHQPLTLEDEEDNCINYPPSAPFIFYEPQNPYTQPDLVPDGYISVPFHHNTDFAYPELFGYQASDIMVQLDAIPVFGDWGDVLGLHFPTIKILVNGQGQIELDLLSVQLGGYAIIKVGSPPNILDLIDGIIETGVVVVDLGQDLTAVPPESDLVISEEINIDVSEPTNVYIVFIPKVDVSTEFFGFGGGIRQIGLCGFEEDALTYVEDVRWNDGEYMLEQRKNGVYEPVTDFSIFLGYFDAVATEANNALGRATATDMHISDDIDPMLADHETRIDALESSQTTQNGRLDDIETLQATHDTSIANLATRMETAEDAIEALEAAQTLEGVWSQEFDFTVDDGGWSGGNPYSAGNGWLISSAALSISKTGANVGDSRVTFVVLQLRRFVGTSFVSATFTLGGENSQECEIKNVAAGSNVQWMQINKIANSYTQELAWTGITGLDSFYIEKLTYWGRGDNPF